eukprot:scaffold315135_cov26-Tisochrysis_lutea.AAC.2
MLQLGRREAGGSASLVDSYVLRTCPGNRNLEPERAALRPERTRAGEDSSALDEHEVWLSREGVT